MAQYSYSTTTKYVFTTSTNEMESTTAEMCSSKRIETLFPITNPLNNMIVEIFR